MSDVIDTVGSYCMKEELKDDKVYKCACTECTKKEKDGKSN